MATFNLKHFAEMQGAFLFRKYNDDFILVGRICE